MRYTFLIMCSILLFIGCKKDSDNQLPAATQIGANTFGAIVNGKVWIPRGNHSIMDDSNNITIDVGYGATTTSGTNLYFLVNDLQDQYSSGFNIYSSVALQEGKSYPLQIIGSPSSNTNVIYFDYHVKSDYYYVVAPLNGELTITKLDVVNKIFSGTFFLDAVNSNGDKVSVTDGRFDVKLK